MYLAFTMNEITMPLKKKYTRRAGKAPKHTYRTRTGPTCCNANCASTKGKSGKKHPQAARAKKH